MKKIIFTIFLIVFLFSLPKFSTSQDKDILDFFKNFKLSTYLDAYYAYDNDKNIFQEQRPLDLISPYRDQIRLNIAAVSLKYNTEKIRSTFTLHYGDIPDANWKPVTKHDMIQEANIGFSPYKNLWIDAGYFVTHIGAEGLPKNNVLSSFSLPVYVEPFIQSGVKIGYDFNDKFSACLHIINGYNLFEDNNKNKSFGLQLSFTPIEQLKISYNNIIGNEMPTGVDGKTRVFNNLIFNIAPCKKIDVIASIDLGIQEKSKRTDTTASAYSYGAFVSARYKFNPKFSTTVRGEFYQDIDGILCGSIGTYNWLKGNGVTIGCEYRPIESAYIRAETRYLRLDKELNVFYKNNERVEGMLSIGFEY
jgi:hypothetical protein